MAKDRDKVRAYMRDRLTPELVARQLASQGNACAICRASFAEVEQHIDHQHGGDVRVLEVQRGSRAVWR